MDIKILNSVPQKKRFVIGTHNGAFHSDEIVAIALLCIKYQNDEVCIVRTRNQKQLSSCYLAVDIGGGFLDHHQPGFCKKRHNRIPYASAGLVWDFYGYSIISSILGEKETHPDMYPDWYSDVYDSIDDDIISKVDAEDNGIKTSPHLFSFINNFLPDWTAEDPDYDAAFFNALSVVIEILRNEIMARCSAFLAEEKINSLLTSDMENIYHCTPLYFNILELPNQIIPWKETVTKYNAKVKLDEAIVKFVIFPYPDGGWAAQCVPPSMEKEFEQLVPFPKEWAGQTDKLPEISGIPDAVLCHNDCFFARAESYLGIRQLCILAMEATTSE